MDDRECECVFGKEINWIMDNGDEENEQLL
jgi:hypothetical protein